MPGTTVSPGGRAASAARPAGGRVVVGERDDVEPGGAGGRQQLGRALGAVGHRGMGVQVDPHRRSACRTPASRRPGGSGHSLGGQAAGSARCRAARRPGGGGGGGGGSGLPSSSPPAAAPPQSLLNSSPLTCR